MADKPRIRVLDGCQAVNGIQTDCIIDHDDNRVILSNDGDLRHLADAAFEAGRQWERLHPILNAGEMFIDDPLGLPPGDE